MIEGLLANPFQKGVDVVTSPLCGGRLLSLVSDGRHQELTLRANNVFLVSAHERFAKPGNHVVVLVFGGSRHIINVREGREAGPKRGTAFQFRF